MFKASEYLFHYSENKTMLRTMFNITKKISSSEVSYGNLTKPSQSGSEEEFHFQLPHTLTRSLVYVAVKVVDDVGKVSAMSNIATVRPPDDIKNSNEACTLTRADLQVMTITALVYWLELYCEGLY